MPRRFIADGCTRIGRLAVSPGHDLFVEYRPMLAQDRAMLVGRIRLLSIDEGSELSWAEQIVLEEMAARIVSMTRRYGSKDAGDISVRALQKLETTLLAALAVLVLDFNEKLLEHQLQRERNLVQGVQLLLTNASVAARDCVDCQKHVYDERTGRRVIHANAPVVRPSGTQPPCRIPCVGCPKGNPEQPRSLSLENQHVYRHFRECRATAAFPDDPIVRRHAVLIDAVELAVFRRSISGVERKGRKPANAVGGRR